MDRPTNFHGYICGNITQSVCNVTLIVTWIGITKENIIMYKILIVEDDITIAKAIKKHLESWGSIVKTVTDFRNVMIDFTEFNPHLVLLDISLPAFNGFHWCDQIRKTSKVPVIFISSASDNMNIVIAMNMGGDDFIAKPFDLTVLNAKIQALLRRTYDFAQLPQLTHNGISLSLDEMSVSYNSQTLKLTKNDFRIFQTLLENHGKIVSRDTLMIKLWETDNYIDDNTLTVNVTRLRKKLAALKLEELIVTKKGVGYIIE